jgi:hypothetical protein
MLKSTHGRKLILLAFSDVFLATSLILPSEPLTSGPFFPSRQTAPLRSSALSRLRLYVHIKLKTRSHTPALTDNQALVGRKVILGHLEVERRRTLPYTARDIVVGAVAGAEPAAEVAGLADGDTAQVRADAQHDEPFGLLDAVGVGLGIAQGCDARGRKMLVFYYGGGMAWMKGRKGRRRT